MKANTYYRLRIPIGTKVIACLYEIIGCALLFVTVNWTSNVNFALQFPELFDPDSTGLQVPALSNYYLNKQKAFNFRPLPVGLCYFCLMVLLGSISACHFNPAITIATLIYDAFKENCNFKDNARFAFFLILS